MQTYSSGGQKHEIGLSGLKSRFTTTFMTWMDLEIIMLTEIIQSVKDKYHMISLIYRI